MAPGRLLAALVTAAMAGSGIRTRMRSFMVSAIYTFPAASTARSYGSFNCALAAGPLSPL
jgi:hypothetical protein